MLFKFYMFLFSMKVALCNCYPEIHKSGFNRAKAHYKITKTGELKGVVNESSGLTPSAKPGLYWTHNDSGGKPELYLVDTNGNVSDTLKISNSKNVDWEDLTHDTRGYIYIGDFGNNSQKRKDLGIYRFKDGQTDKITFRYADQTDYPAKEPVFDCEAFFWFNNNLYLFSKDKSTKHVSKLYVMPDKPGDYTVSPIDSIYIKTQVTAADVSPDGKEFALLTYGKIFTFEIANGKIDFSKPKGCIKVGRKQTEAIVYSNNTDFIVTNEQRSVYTLRKKK
ncbi:hypothetical protein C0V77_21160 [Emticicia sp. TH156]|nr:hypothetical protein C0V77_21160 [Emticicia sp. TH156]